MNHQKARRRLPLLGALAVPDQAAAEVCDSFVASAACDAVRTAPRPDTGEEWR
jgi:hypothetical protein